MTGPTGLVRAAATIGGLTLISRLLGFVRDVAFAAILGAGPIADAFLLAQRFPNLFRSLFAEGAFASAFVPLFAKNLAKEGEAKAKTFAEEALSVLVPALIALTLIVQVAMPWIMTLFAAGFVADQSKFDLTVLFSRIMFPYLLLMALCALYAGILNSLGRFSVAAAAPILFNLVLILALVVVAPLTGLPGHGQAVGVTLSGLLQVLWMAWAARRAGMSLRLTWPRLTPAVRQLLATALPGTFAAGITQVNILIGQIIASWTAGAVAWLYFAERLYQLPLGVIGIALSAVLLPDLSRRFAQDDQTGANATLNRAIEMSLFLTLPAALALAVAPLEILTALFRRGAFGTSDALAAAPALTAFAAGLPAYVLIKVLTPAFFARQDTKTPVAFASVSVVLNILGSILLYPLVDYVGIAIATAISAWTNVALLAWRLFRNKVWVPDWRLADRLLRILAAAILMALAFLGLVQAFKPALFGPTHLALPALALVSALGLALYAAATLATGALTLSDLRAALRRRPKIAALPLDD